jgi:GntR family transcriptional regulator / MocR family aminotransferase
LDHLSILELVLEPLGPRRRALETALRTAIREGRLDAGTRLPSTRVLATDLGVARGTVVEAYTQLEAEGYLGARRGAGTWVADVRVAPSSRTPRDRPIHRPARFSFNPGLPDLTAFPRAAWASALRRGLRGASAASLGYGDPRGRPELREALSAYLARARGAVADPERIVVCAGVVHALSLLSRVLRAQGVDTMAMEDPCLRWHRRVVTAAGLDVVPLPVDGRGARTDFLDATRAAAVVLTPAHQFPLGAVLRPERRVSAVGWARRAGGLVIEDDYDAELRYDRQPVGVVQALDPEHVAVVGTTSKTLAPGLRLGWMLVPEALVEPLVELRTLEDVHVPALEQIAFTEFLATGGFERHVRRMRSRYRARRDRLLAMLAAHVPAVRPVGISAGLRVLLELPPGSRPASEIVDRASKESIELFALAPCHHDGRADPDGLVVGYAALPEHDFESGLEALGGLLGRTVST